MGFLLLDTTLREGEQGGGITFTPAQRLLLAEALDEFGVDFIEISPVVSSAHRKTTRDLVAMGLSAQIVAHCRATVADVEIALDTGAPWLALFFPTSDLHLQNKLKGTLDQLLPTVEKAIDHAKEHGARVRFTCEDASRTPSERLLAISQMAQNAGCDRVSIPDTIGLMTPQRMRELISCLHSRLRTPLDVHCHNDLGLALANSLAGLEAGATCVHVSINGVGERCGITRLAELVMSLRVLQGMELNVRMDKMCSLSQMLSEFTGATTSPFSPVVGENAFTHKGGTHIAAVMNNYSCYEPFAPSTVGNRRRFVLGEHSGKNTLHFLNQALQLGLDPSGVERALTRLKQKNGDLLEFEV